MSDYYLMHSAKGTSWFKKEHKYIKKVDGKYYYLTKEECKKVDAAQEAYDEAHENLTRVVANYQEADTKAEAYANEAKKYQNKANTYKTNASKAGVQNPHATQLAANSAKRISSKVSANNANARSQQARAASNRQAASAYRYQQTRVTKWKNSVIEGKGIKWINNLIDKLNKK